MDAVISVNGSICASLKCEKVQKDCVYKVGVWNRIVFAISTFYNPAICLKKLADVSSEDRSMTFILHIQDHSDPGVSALRISMSTNSCIWHIVDIGLMFQPINDYLLEKPVPDIICIGF